MASSGNLEPTPIVDKNGKHTTVYRKNTSQATNKRALPSPAVKDTAQELKQLRASIAYDLSFIEVDHITTRQEQRFMASLNSMSHEDLTSLHQTVHMVNELDQQGGPRRNAAIALSYAVENKDADKIRIIREHGPKIDGHLTMGDLIAVVEKLRSMDNSRVQFTPNLGAHIEAAGKFLSITGTETPDYYNLNEKFIRFINKHPDQVDDALAFRQQFALKTYPEDQFQEWLSAGALRDGVL